MPSDPQLLSEVLASPPEEADYDALYAELMASPRGRWFLTEYAGRNRFADTHLLAGAIARVEAAVRGEPVPQVPAAVAREIADLAVAIGRIEDEFVAPLRLASEGFAAAERIQDVAFALREREVDAEMSDVLEAAIRELGEIFARGDAAAERVQNALALLRELKSRVHAMVADAVAGAGVSPAAVTAAETPSEMIADDGFGEEGDISDALLAERSAADAQADEHFAAMIGALAASFPASDEPPAPDEAGEAAPEPLGEFAEAVSPPAEPEAAFEPATEPQVEVGQGGEDIGGSMETQAPPAESSLAATPMTEEVSTVEPPGDEAAAAAEQEVEPADVESEKALALPEPVEQALAVIQQLDTEELAKEEPPPDATASGRAVVLPERPVSEPAAAEDVAAESPVDHGLAHQGLAAADARDAGDETATPLVVPGSIDDGGTPGEHETPPLLAESPAADREENLDGVADEAPSSQAESPDHGDVSAGEAVPPPHLPDEPPIGPADVPTMDVPTTDLPAEDLSAAELPAADLPAADLPAVELPPAELSAADLAEPVLVEAASGLEQESVPSQPKPEDNSALVARDETEIVPDDARQVDVTSDYILGGGIAPGGGGVERFDNTVKETISEPIQTPAVAEPITPILKEAETTQQVLPDLQAAPGPEEDPADLFEPLPMPSPFPAPQSVPVAPQPAGAAPAAGAAMSLFDTPITYEGGAAVPGRAAAVELQDGARAPVAVAQTNQPLPAASPAAGLAAAPSPQMRLPLENSTPQPQPRPAAPMPRGIPRPAPSDPLASLSEEELIALFS
jgi:hypothetical protein